MSLWRQVTRGLRHVVGRKAADCDLADEVQSWLDEARAAYVAEGLAPDAAERAARLELGSVAAVREQLRSQGWEHRLEQLGADVRFAWRRLLGEPGFAALVIVTLALGIGASTTIFSAVNPILLRPLPYPGAEELVTLWDAGDDGSRVEVTYGNFLELQQRTHSFAALAVYRAWQPTLTGNSEPERLDGQLVSPEFFRAIGIAPSLGRDFQPEDDLPGDPVPVILSDALWRRRFGADPAILGRPIRLADASYQVIGVMPPSLENVLAPGTVLWAPLRYDLTQGRAWGHHLRMVGRLRPGITPAATAAEVRRVGQTPIAEFPRPAWAMMSEGLRLTGLQADVTAGVRPALLAVLGAVALLLVLACVNVSNLVLARGVRRRGEFAVRVALGAGRFRLARQLLVEHLLLAALGGAAGLLAAGLGIRILVALSPADLPRLGAIRLDPAAFGIGLGLTALAGLAFGSVSALQAMREEPQGTLHLVARRTSGGHRRIRQTLVITQVALALVLLAGAGLLGRSLVRLFAVDAGFHTPGLLTLQIQTAGPRVETDAATRAFFDQALAAVRGVPGVESAALTSQLPLGGEADRYGVHFAPAVPDDRGENGGSFRYSVSPGYIETMGIPLLRGRTLDERDAAGGTPVALISESVARHQLSGRDPLGQRLRIGPANGPLYQVVGVVGDVRQLSLAREEREAVYIPAAQWFFADRVMSLVVRTRADPASLAPAVRRAIWSVDKDQAIVRIATMDALVRASAGERRFALQVLGGFGLAALLLAAAGIYGVVSGSVVERTREIGVRAALGATRTRIVRLVLAEGLTLTGFGVGLGLAGGLAATGTLRSLLFGVTRLDPVTYVGVVFLLVAIALLACLLPAWRAARIDPARTLRAE